ncbi:response regulator transcription factor [Sphingopyxis sp. PET50]|uniref:response regulator transcription factor n=1 Tax=Sphingopyxis sp. PET50 TaxID=2976533 RepID=UPI0021AE7B5A|nr:response regulator transcription factor [Sphingopyxis sp. PET50]
MRAALLKVLRTNGFHCLSAPDGYSIMTILTEQDVDLILLDVMMPGISGFDICRDLRLRHDNPVPVIMISARGDEADKVTGLELGADDYIAKPFGDSELLARVRAMLRRAHIAPAPAAPRVRQLRFGDWAVDLPQRQLFAPSGARVELSGAEYDLLLALLEHPQRVIGREPLLEMSRSRLGNASDRTIDVHICRLRRKLGDEERRELIRTVRGVGYIFTAAVERA